MWTIGAPRFRLSHGTCRKKQLVTEIVVCGFSGVCLSFFLRPWEQFIWVSLPWKQA